MAIAAGRPSGTLCAGAIHSYVDPAFSTRGMRWCYLVGAVSNLMAKLVTYLIKDDAAGLHCDACVCIEASQPDEVEGLPSPEKGVGVPGVGQATNTMMM